MELDLAPVRDAGWSVFVAFVEGCARYLEAFEGGTAGLAEMRRLEAAADRLDAWAAAALAQGLEQLRGLSVAKLRELVVGVRSVDQRSGGVGAAAPGSLAQALDRLNLEALEQARLVGDFRARIDAAAADFEAKREALALAVLEHGRLGEEAIRATCGEVELLRRGRAALLRAHLKAEAIRSLTLD